MAEQLTTERDRADAPDMREGRRFPVSRGGWIGIAAAILGVAYFVIPEETAKQASDLKPPPETRVEVPQPVVTGDEVVGPTVREKPAEERTAGAKGEMRLKMDVGRSERSRSEKSPVAADGALPTGKP